jgi:hypothetical protein
MAEAPDPGQRRSDRRQVPDDDQDRAADRDDGLLHLLTAVHRTVQADGRALLCPAEGRAGTGATTAMVEFAHRHAHDHDIAWWIPAADPELVPIHLV